MNVLQTVIGQPSVERLGWTLLHFVWQGFSIALVYICIRRFVLRSSSSQARYLLACGGLAAMMIAPLVTWELGRPRDASAEGSYRIRDTPLLDGNVGLASGTVSPSGRRVGVSGTRAPEFLGSVVLLWLTGVVIFWTRLATAWIAATRLKSMRVRQAPPEWQRTLTALAGRMKLSRPVGLLVSAQAHAPAVVGWLRPVVLAPVGALSGLPAEQLEALLIHELAHIRRHDYLVNILQSAVEALLFYHPAVWWVSRHIRVERELCCDDVAVSLSGDALTYARALAQLESYRHKQFAMAVAADDGSLANRIARLLGHSRPAVSAGLGPGTLAVAVVLIATAYGMLGQSQAQPAFEAASIKRNPNISSEPTHEPMWVRHEAGGRLRAKNAPLTLLIQRAYGVQPFQIVGGPAWINTDRYDIEAKPEGNTDRNQTWLMLQTLLADRFKLRLRREVRTLPVYDLVVSKNGPRLPVPKSVDCVSRPPDFPVSPSGRGKVDCGHVSGPFSGASTRLRLEGNKVNMAEFIKQLAMVMGRPVLDKTNFKGEFDLIVSFAADGATQGLPGFGGAGDPGGSRLPTDPDRPNTFGALEEQLGLKLISAKGPAEVLVVHHVERPAAN